MNASSDPSDSQASVRKNQTEFGMLRKCLDVIWTTYKSFGCTGKVNLDRDTERWLGYARSLPLVVGKKGSCVDWVGVVKYKLAAFYSSVTHEPILPGKPFPEEDRPDVLLGGGAGRWFQHYMNTKDRMERESLALSVLFSKRGMPRPGQEYLDAAEAKTESTLTSEDPTSHGPMLTAWADMPDNDVEYGTTPYAVKAQIKRTVAEIFASKNAKKFTLEDRLRSMFPSVSASYVASRSELGALGALFTDGVFKQAAQGGHSGIEIEWSKDIHKGQDARRTEEDEQIDDEDSMAGPEFKTDEGRARSARLWWLCLKRASEESMDVSLSPLAESLKVRVISKGPPYTYYVLKALQRKMWRTLVSHKSGVFRLIGEPITAAYLDQQLKMSHRSEGYSTLLSGDYADATNQIKSYASEACAEEIAKQLNLSEIETRLFLASLTGAKLNDKSQRRGQLMGSITSFPVLCIVNAAMCRWALEVDRGRRLKLDECALAVNGDDCALRGSKRLYWFWRRIAGLAGLKESIGKTYMSEDRVQMNSRCYIYQDGFREVPFVNLGLVYDLQRSGGSGSQADESSSYANSGAQARELLATCPAHMRERLYTLFLRNRRKKFLQTRLPYFMPRWMGGLGLPILGRFRPSDKDLRIAATILLNWKYRRPINLQPPQAFVGYRVVEKQLEKAGLKTYPTSDEAAINDTARIRSLMLLDNIFSCNSDDLHALEAAGIIRLDLLGPNKSSVARHEFDLIIRRNEHLWNPRVSPPAGVRCDLDQIMSRLKGEAGVFRLDGKAVFPTDLARTRVANGVLPDSIEILD